MRYLMMIVSVVWMLAISLQANAGNCKNNSINKTAQQIILKLLEQQSSETKAIKLVVG